MDNSAQIPYKARNTTYFHSFSTAEVEKLMVPSIGRAPKGLMLVSKKRQPWSKECSDPT